MAETLMGITIHYCPATARDLQLGRGAASIGWHILYQLESAGPLEESFKTWVTTITARDYKEPEASQRDCFKGLVSSTSA